MKKILILGLILTSVGCSLDDQDKINREAALAALKGTYQIGIPTAELMNKTFSDADVRFDGRVTIHNLEFLVGKAIFTYQDLKDGWIVYKITSGTTTKYTALAPDSSGNIAMEHTAFRDNIADVSPNGVQGHPFLMKE